MIVKRIMQGMVWGLALLSLGTYVRVVLARLPYPLELDCIEGVMMDHVVRLAHGQPMYVRPSLDFISLAYMPFFALVGSWITRFFEPALWQARVVSAAASFGTIALIIAVVRAETRNLTLAVAGAGVYALAFGFVGSCYDVARPDSLMLFLSMGGLAVLRFTRGNAGAIVSALVLSLAFFTKQHAVLFVGAGGLALLSTDRRRLLPYLVTALVGCLGGYLLLWAWLGDWFRVYTWDIPRGWSEIDRARIQHYIVSGVFGTFAVFSLSAVLALGTPRRVWRGASGLWWFAGLGAFGTGLLATLDPSAYKHVYIPTVVAFSILGPIALHHLSVALDDAEHSLTRGALGQAAVCFVAAVQFMPLLYPVHAQMPHAHAVEARTELDRLLQLYPGPWLMPYHGFYLYEAGKGTSLDLVAFDDIVRSHGNSILEKDPQFVTRMVDSLRTAEPRRAILTDLRLSDMGPLWARIEPAYELVDSLGWITEALRPVTGNRFAPTYVYLPKADSTHAATLRRVAGSTTP